MKRPPGFNRRTVNDHFNTRVASRAAPNGCRRSIAPPTNPIYLFACHAAQGRSRPGTPDLTLPNGLRRPLLLPADHGAPNSERTRQVVLRVQTMTSGFTEFSSVMSEARCDAGSARRQLEKQPVGVPIGGGAAFVPGASPHLVIQTIPYRPADHPSRIRLRSSSYGETSPEPWRRRGRIVSHRRRVVFPRVGRGTEPLI